MKQLKLYGPGDIRIDDAPKPYAGDNDVVVKVSACGICGSDISFAANGPITPDGTPMPIGHELSGEIVEVGSKVAAIDQGMRVVVDPMTCDNSIGTGSSEGGFAEYLLVKNARLNGNVYPIPDSLGDEAAALAEPLAVALHGINQGNPRSEEKVVLIGAGPIGLCAIAALRHRGVDNIVAADFSRARLQRAENLGATPFLASEQSMTNFLSERHGTVVGFAGLEFPTTDLYIDCSGAAPVISDIVNTARQGARVVMLGVPKQAVPMDFSMVILKELNFAGSFCYPTEFRDAIELLANAVFEAELLISHRFDIDDFPMAMETAADANVSAKVLVTF